VIIVLTAGQWLDRYPIRKTNQSVVKEFILALAVKMRGVQKFDIICDADIELVQRIYYIMQYYYLLNKCNSIYS
jgi:hypothetical protein